MAVARDKAGEKHHVIAVVGDGSLTGGVALEALNQIGHLRERLIIVLNYNEMSISPNVGAWSKYLSYLVSGQHLYPDEGPGQVHPQVHPQDRLAPDQGRAGLRRAGQEDDLPRPRLQGARHPLRRPGRGPQHPVPRRGLRAGQDVRRADPHPVRDAEGQGLPAGPDAPRKVPRRRAVPGLDGRAAATANGGPRSPASSGTR